MQQHNRTEAQKVAAFVESHGNMLGMTYGTNGFFIAVETECVKDGIVVSIETEVIPATMKAARELLGY